MVCVCAMLGSKLCSEANQAQGPTKLRGEPFAWVLRGVYIGLPPGGTMVIRLGAGPSRQCLCSPASPPAVGSLVDRQAPLSTALSGAGYCCSILVTRASPRWAWLQCRRPAGDRCSLTASCLLNGASPLRGWQAGWREPAPSWADWGRPGRLRVSLCPKGPTAHGPRWQPIVDDIRVNVATVLRRTGHGHPYGALCQACSGIRGWPSLL